MNVRQLHTYIGLFIAPSVLFFALTGALQLFSLHEAHGTYEPPALIEKLSKVHKDQVFAVEPKEPPTGASGADAGPPDHHHHHDDDDQPSLSTVLLKWYFLAVSVGLTGSTAIGIWLGLTHVRHRRVGLILLIAGALLPVLLLVL